MHGAVAPHQHGDRCAGLGTAMRCCRGGDAAPLAPEQVAVSTGQATGVAAPASTAAAAPTPAVGTASAPRAAPAGSQAVPLYTLHATYLI